VRHTHDRKTTRIGEPCASSASCVGSGLLGMRMSGERLSGLPVQRTSVRPARPDISVEVPIEQQQGLAAGGSAVRCRVVVMVKAATALSRGDATNVLSARTAVPSGALDVDLWQLRCLIVELRGVLRRRRFAVFPSSRRRI
jgi:hypothetical protein